MTAAKQSGVTKVEREANQAIREQYLKLKNDLTERARRLFVASEACAFGYGVIAVVARATGVTPSVIGPRSLI